MEATDKQQILQRLNNMEDVLTDLKKVVKEYFEETTIEKTVEAGDGYYLLKKGDMIQEGDEFMNLSKSVFNDNSWHPVISTNWEVLDRLEFKYRRKIPIPEGWERVRNGQISPDGTYRIWTPLNNVFIDMHPFAIRTANAFVIRQLKSKLKITLPKESAET